MRYRHGSREVGEVMMRDEVFNGRGHGACGLVVESEDDDPAMRSRWIGADVPETAVEGKHDSLLGDRGGQHLRIRVAREVLGEHGVRVDPVLRQALVELDLHGAVRSGTRCGAAQGPPAPDARRRPLPRGSPARSTPGTPRGSPRRTCRQQGSRGRRSPAPVSPGCTPARGRPSGQPPPATEDPPPCLPVCSPTDAPAHHYVIRTVRR